MAGRNRNFIQQGNRLPLQALGAYYIPPKTAVDIKEEMPNYRNLTIDELKQKLIDEHKFVAIKEDTDKLAFYKENGLFFKFRDGKSDVYTKGGYDIDIFEYLDRQYTETIKWRIETNSTIDFVAGGKILMGDKELFIAKVLNIITSGSRENKFLAMRNYDNIERYATKMLALI